MDDLDKSIKRHERRRKRFRLEGLSETEAWDLADQLFERDRQNLDMRVCFECSNYNDEKKVCGKICDLLGRPQRPLRFTLQRCPTFQLREAK